MIFRKGPLVGFAFILILASALVALLAAPKRSMSQAEATEVELVDTCPQGYLLHRGNNYVSPGMVCVPGYIPTKKPSNPSLKQMGQQ